MKKICFTLLLVALSQSLLAQFGESIRTGRPGQAAGMYALGKNVFQVQTGLTFSTCSNELSSTQVLTQPIVLRYGLTEQFEISGVTGWKSHRTDYSNTSESLKKAGIYTTQFGVRFHVIDNKGPIPGLGIQYRIFFNAQSKDFRPQHLGGRLLVLTKSTLAPGYNLVTNWGLTWNGNETSPDGLYVINNSFSISDKIGTFIEFYGNFLTDNVGTNLYRKNITFNIDTGLSYLINNDLQLDLSAGIEKIETKGSNGFFVDAGVSWRLHNR